MYSTILTMNDTWMHIAGPAATSSYKGTIGIDPILAFIILYDFFFKVYSFIYKYFYSFYTLNKGKAGRKVFSHPIANCTPKVRKKE